jgi:extracellular elastinolytic metalloproteinase
MFRFVAPSALTVVALTVAIPAAAQDLASRDARSARVVRPSPGGILTAPSTAARATIVAEFLQSRGADARTAASLRAGTERIDAATGLRLVSLEQEADGLQVYGSYAKATFSAQGELLHLIENLAQVPPAGVLRANIDAAQALRAALRTLYPASAFNPVAAGRDGNVATFAAGSFFYRDPIVTAVAVPMTDNMLRAGFVVETWSREGNQLHHTVVAGDGRVLAVESRTSQDSYNVFAVNPGVSAQLPVSGPAPVPNIGQPGLVPSPAGWLGSTSQSTVNISGNNVRSYLDADNNNQADAGGVTVSSGVFDSVADLGAQPTAQTNRNVAVQNLFYLNNRIHDLLYQYGFDEAAGNFQTNNFGRGGAGNDPVNAEAQDGGGTDNANFATPADGSSPRMQMYLWTGKGDHQVLVSGGTSYPAAGASFGPALSTTGVTGPLRVAPVADGCSSMPAGSLSGLVAIVDRGTCDFVVKVRNAQAAGAVAVIVANNAGDDFFTMGPTDRKIKIPAVMVGQSSGVALKGTDGPATVRKNPVAPLNLDGSVDADIVYHEYCHGLTWRMIGSMSGAMSGAIGEGMSDVCALLITNNDKVGEYSSSTPGGIRRAPYTDYPNTYADFGGTSVHADGEIYAGAIWRLKQTFELNGRSVETLFRYLVQGMTQTPAGPYFEDMRDGILSVAAPADHCLIWKAFAASGIGDGASATPVFKRGKVTFSIHESSTVPVSCP